MRSVLILGLLGVGVACASASSTVAVPGAADETITRGAFRALRSLWDRAEPGRPPSAPCPTAPAAPAPLVRGDFNGDGTEDVVLWVTVDETPRLAALFARLGGEYTAVELGEGAVIGAAALEVARRGTGYQLTALTVDSYFGLDTVVLRACEGTRTAWLWTGSTFQAQPLDN